MKRAALLPSAGIGDALLMMIAAHRLLQEGFSVTTYHPGLIGLQEWFPGHVFAKAPDLESLHSLLDSVDLLIVQNDNSSRIKHLLQCKTEQRKKLSIFYATYSLFKHGPLSTKDQVFNAALPMAENLSHAIAKLLASKDVSKDNGLRIPEGLHQRRFPKRVIIHPTSSSSQKNWPTAKYLELARLLDKQGYTTALSLSPQERASWKNLGTLDIEAPPFTSLHEVATYIYESGYVIGNDSLIGHLASNLHIPTLIIADNEERMRLWRPGWLQGEVLTPPA